MQIMISLLLDCAPHSMTFEQTENQIASHWVVVAGATATSLDRPVRRRNQGKLTTNPPVWDCEINLIAPLNNSKFRAKREIRLSKDRAYICTD